ncbi:MAG: IPT/TIG domain-containing protein [Actinobacteria bacterium]|nr:IPT/TIG domain-containing protein [Actinomycetota bacterium]
MRAPRQAGATSIEYGLIIAVIGVVVVIAVSLLGDSMKSIFTNAVNALSGSSAPTGPVPTVTALSPSSGTKMGGQTVTVTGTNFESGANVAFGGVTAPSVIFVSSVRLSVTTPAYPSVVPAPLVDVTVINPGGRVGVRTAGYTYRDPGVTSAAPNHGPLAGGTSVVVTGYFFAAGATVTFGGVAATDVVLVDANTLTVTTPASATAGLVSVTVTNADGRSGSRAGVYRYE